MNKPKEEARTGAGPEPNSDQQEGRDFGRCCGGANRKDAYVQRGKVDLLYRHLAMVWKVLRRTESLNLFRSVFDSPASSDGAIWIVVMCGLE